MSQRDLCGTMIKKLSHFLGKGQAMPEKIRKLRSDMEFNIVAAIVLLLVVFGIIVSIIGVLVGH